MVERPSPGTGECVVDTVRAPANRRHAGLTHLLT